MKILLSLCLCIAISTLSVAQSSLNELATSFANAYINKDYQTIVTLTHPDIITKGGGEKLAIADLKANLNNPKSEMLEYTSTEVGEPIQFFESNGETQTLVPIRFFLEFGDDLYANTTHFLAVSEDKTEWRFVNLEYYDEESLKIFIENLSDQIMIPENKPFEKLVKEQK